MSGPPVYSFRKKVTGEVPIMSFQTDKNGTFNPVITPSSGTLRWVIGDSYDEETNSPSVELVGDTVDVKVFANDVSEGENISSSMGNQNIIGALNFEYFTFTGAAVFTTNNGLTDLIFSAFTNTPSLLRAQFCNLSSLDLSNVTLSGQFDVDNNPNLTNIIFSTSGNTASLFDVNSCNLSSLDLSGFTSISSSFNATANSNLTGFISPTSISNIGAFTMSSCDITGVLDLTKFNMTQISLQSNINMTGVIFNANAKVFTSVCDINNCNLSSIDLSSITMDSRLRINVNTNLSSYTLPAGYSTNMNQYNAQNCDLNTSIIDSIFADLNTFFSSNAPISNIIVVMNGGTNGSPTGGSSNADLVNLRDVVYPNAGFTFTATIN